MLNQSPKAYAIRTTCLDGVVFHADNLLPESSIVELGSEKYYVGLVDLFLARNLPSFQMQPSIDDFDER